MDTTQDEEVKKLQALVKELELQNEELRSERQLLKKDEPHTHTPTEPGTPNKNPHPNPHPHYPETPNKDGDLENMDPIGLEENNLSDEETWLFDSPKTKAPDSDWLRKDVDDPALFVSKKSLIHKLDQIALSPHQSPRHSSPCSSSGILSPESPPSSRDASSREYLARSSGSLGSEEDDRLSSASEGSFSYQLTDVADVNALARLQEESIRAGPPSSNPYSPAGSIGSATSSQEDLIASAHPASPHRRPPHTRGLQPPQRYSGGQGTASREGSDVSTPPDSPYNSQHNLEICNGRSGGLRQPGGLKRGGLGGSDPRLLDHNTPTSSRGASPARHSPSSSQQDIRQPSRSSKIQPPHMRTRMNAPSPVRVPGATSAIPQPSDLPRPKTTGIPRPGTSRLQAPKTRSGLAQPRFQAPTSDDWRDGCF
ncbi:hypothetical protein Pcinc_030550 [Petrolisthes cinctipes]|uniref:SLAIN motif family member 2 n=1 Tax=Petrolisthes cinctipes TaxID=88211 RepID=A0AAE1K426_PETCI|nr:hypothetical protein Pcinc_030550 [Petrolisthes cinctipes]